MKSVNHHTRLFAIAVCFFLIVLSSCSGTRNIVGTWRKIPGSVCGEIYPEKVTFLPDGSYAGGLMCWNGGGYDLVNDKMLKLDTTTGLALYEYKLADDVVTFRTDWGCEFKYRREE
jgi:hypothetical protein